MRKLAALILRRNKLTSKVNLLMATEVLCSLRDTKEELQISADGKSRIVALDPRVWDDIPIRGENG